MEVFIGTVMPFPYNFAPRGWFPCSGQLLSIASYSALYALIGVTYGGDGRTNFALPNLNTSTSDQAVRIALGQGNGPGLTPRVIGQAFGEDAHTITTQEMPMHNHAFALFSGAQGKTEVPPAGGILVDPNYTGFVDPSIAPPDTTLAPVTIGPAGGGQAHNNDQPALSLFYCICYEGIFPSFG